MWVKYAANIVCFVHIAKSSFVVSLSDAVRRKGISGVFKELKALFFTLF